MSRRRGFIDLYLDVGIAYGIIVVLVVVCLTVLVSHITG